MARASKWVDLRCCDWDTFLSSLMVAAQRLSFPLILVNRCEARSYWRRYSCTGYEALLVQRNREIHDALYLGYGEPPEQRGSGGGRPKDPSPQPPTPVPGRSPALV